MGNVKKLSEIAKDVPGIPLAKEISSEVSKEVAKKKVKIEEVKVDKSGNKVRRRGLPRTGTVVLPKIMTSLIQPTTLTLMRHDYSALEVRVFITMVEKLQAIMEERLKGNNQSFDELNVQLNLFNELDKENIYMQVPIKDFGVSPDRYKEIKSALTRIATLPIELDTINPITKEPSIFIQGLFTAYLPKEKFRRTTTIVIKRDVADQLVRMDQGFTKFIKEIIYQSNNKYTIKLYLWISSWKNKGGVSILISKFRKWLMLEDKYKSYADLYKRVIFPAYEDLHEKADCWFEVAEITRPGEKEPFKLNFKIISAVLNEKDKLALEGQKRNIEGLLFRHFKMQDRQISKIKLLLSLENAQKVMLKIMELKDYTEKHSSEISSIPNYCYSAIMDCIEQGYCDEYTLIEDK